MRHIKRYLIAIMLAATLFIYAHKPSDHEIVSESPTETHVELTHYPTEDIPLQAPSPPIIVEEKAVVDVKPTQQAKPVKLNMRASFYTAGCDGCSGITKTGDNVRNTIYAQGYRVIAVDPRVIPLRSIVKVELENGQTFNAVASDIGGAIKNDRIDVLVASKDEAYRLGRQTATVTILQNGKGR